MSAEILAPAGNREALDAAFAAGSDAVYFGLPLFGARAFAKNFSLEETADIIKQAHLVGMKVYITMNTLLEENQMEQAFDWARQLAQMGVDALIIQDLGFLHLLHERIPQLELHASTQLSVTTSFQIEQLKKLGVKRVVMAREATLEQIRECRKTGMDLEVFVHGALCICYSGQCQFSQVRYGRSGNKGACAQPCRMEYTLLENGKPKQTDGAYLISPRDLSVLEQIPLLEDAGVDSLKIEGRMKSPAYVYESVTMARKARAGQKLDLSDRLKLMAAFNRGYTRGHLFSKTGEDLMNTKTSNHQGIPLGTVKRVTGQKAWIELDEDLFQEDGLRFEGRRGYTLGQHANFIYGKEGKLIREAKKGETVGVKVSGNVYPGMSVRKTLDARMEKDVERAVSQEERQAPVIFHLFAPEEGAPILLEAKDLEGHKVQVEGPQAQKARNAGATIESVSRQLERTGNSWANAQEIKVTLKDGLFLPASVLNDLRRRALDLLAQKRMETEPVEIRPYTYQPQQPAPLFNIIEINKKEQADLDGLIPDNTRIVSQFPFANAAHKADLLDDEGLVSAHLAHSQIVEDLNVTNSYALAALLQMGYQGALLSDELSDEARKEMMDAFKKRYGFDAPVIETIYQKPRLMLMNHCPVNTALKDGTRKNCALCRQNSYELEGRDGKKVWLYGSPRCQMQLFDQTIVDHIDQIPQLEKEGISHFRLVFTNEDARQIRPVLSHFDRALQKEEDQGVK